MKTKVIQALEPADLKAEIDAIVLADSPTFLHVVPHHSRAYYIIIWS